MRKCFTVALVPSGRKMLAFASVVLTFAQAYNTYAKAFKNYSCFRAIQLKGSLMDIEIEGCKAVKNPVDVLKPRF